ncbi:dihydrolipoamide acetyltransferase family protein [Deinococcus sp.]|uniref:dihydrolipoamide acetyltransferase family protein n=1 Tax=Deinococcus sp. TaxID=47478 RepID=UPI003CC66DE4
MSRQILLPELAESVVEGEILKWLVQEGEQVALEQPLCEVMTDKVTVELPSPYAGILEKRLVPEGALVAVHAPIALISDAGAPQPDQQGRGGLSNPPPQTERLTVPEETEPEEPGEPDESEEPDTSLFRAIGPEDTSKDTAAPPLSGLSLPASTLQAPVSSDSPASGRVLAVPAARQLARELGIELGQVSGSGPNGRIRPLDVHRHAQERAPSAGAPGASAQAGPSVAPVTYRTPKGYEHLERRVPLRGLRRAISTQMQASHLYTVRTLTVDEADLTRLVELRARLNAELEAGEARLSYLPFILKALVAALKKYPSLNTSLDEASGEIVQKAYYHLGLAVATETGLLVPVIRDADQKSLLDLNREVKALAERARSNQLTSAELSGSSFSVTNIGSVGALFSFPIINVPDAAILGVHSIVRRPIVTPDGQIVAADMMYLSLSFDHRLVDGAEAARFCREVIRLLERPERLLISD